MIWTDVLLYVTFGLLAAVVLFWMLGLLWSRRRQSVNTALGRLTYWSGLGAVILNLIRSFAVYSAAIIAANFIALGCMAVAYFRFEKELRRPTDRPTE